MERTKLEIDVLEKKLMDQSAAAAAKDTLVVAKVVEDDGDGDGDGDDDALPVPAPMMPYSKGLVRGDLCAFTTGYFTFLEETKASVRSLFHFMPGMRVRVAVDPMHFSVFNR